MNNSVWEKRRKRLFELIEIVSKEITLQQRNPWTNQKIRDLEI